MTQAWSKATQGGRLGGMLLWFAVLGGAVAWILHLLIAWGVDEITCGAGRHEINGASLVVVLVWAVALPASVALAALALAVVAWQRTRRGDRQRARLMATAGIWVNLLFVAIIAFDAVAIVMFSPCQT